MYERITTITYQGSGPLAKVKTELDPTKLATVLEEMEQKMKGYNKAFDVLGVNFNVEKPDEVYLNKKKTEELQPKKIKIMADKAYYEDMDRKIRSFDITPPHTDTEKLQPKEEKVVRYEGLYGEEKSFIIHKMSPIEAIDQCIEIVKKYSDLLNDAELETIITALESLKK